jgi:hypothetical protein
MLDKYLRDLADTNIHFAKHPMLLQRVIKFRDQYADIFEKEIDFEFNIISMNLLRLIEIVDLNGYVTVFLKYFFSFFVCIE